MSKEVNSADEVHDPHGSGQSPGGTREQLESRVVKLKGLPYHVTKKEIVEFFGEGLEVIYVHFVFDPFGRPSGLAFAEFLTSLVALKALKKCGHYLQKRYIKILHVSYEEMREQVLLGTSAIPQKQLQPSNSGPLR